MKFRIIMSGGMIVLVCEGICNMNDLKLKIIKYAKDEYDKIFGFNYIPTYKSQEDIKALLNEFPKSSICIWKYCCYGIYNNCWQDEFFVGNWGMTQDYINQTIISVFSMSLLDTCKVDNRMFVYEESDSVNLLIVARDLDDHQCDYLISFRK